MAQYVQPDQTGIAYTQQSLATRIRSRHAEYVTRRSLYDDQRDVIVELTRPDIIKGQVGEKNEGAFGSSAIVEGTAPFSALVWQRGFLGGTVSRRMEWFRDNVQEPDPSTGVKFKGNDEVNAWLQDVTDVMTYRYARSNYYDVMPQFVMDGGTVGSPVMLFQQDLPNDRTICKVPDYAAVWLDKDIFGYDNACHVLWEWTALQAYEFFGLDQLPPEVKLQLESGQHFTKTQYIQCIYSAGDPIYRDLKDYEKPSHPWLEHFVCISNNSTYQTQKPQLLQPKNQGPGYFARPFSSWHYHRNWHEVYSKTMAWFAVYDIRGLNAMWEALFGEAELSLRPAIWAHGSQRGWLDLAPGGENYAKNRAEYEMMPKFMQRPTNYQAGKDMTQEVKASVERWFHVPLFMMIQNIMNQQAQPETAYGLMRAEAERTGQLAPQIETFENQILGHSHDVFMDIERMADPLYPWGRLPKPPDIVLEYGDGEVNPEFIGQLSLAQIRDREILKFYRNIGTAEVILNIDPMTRNKVRWADGLEDVLEAGDFPQRHIVGAEEYDKVVQAINERTARQEAAETGLKQAQAVKALGGGIDAQSPLKLLGAGA